MVDMMLLWEIDEKFGERGRIFPTPPTIVHQVLEGFFHFRQHFFLDEAFARFDHTPFEHEVVLLFEGVAMVVELFSTRQVHQLVESKARHVDFKEGQITAASGLCFVALHVDGGDAEEEVLPLLSNHPSHRHVVYLHVADAVELNAHDALIDGLIDFVVFFVEIAKRRVLVEDISFGLHPSIEGLDHFGVAKFGEEQLAVGTQLFLLLLSGKGEEGTAGEKEGEEGFHDVCVLL